MSFLAIKLLLDGWLSVAGKWIGGAWSWATASTARMLGIALVASLCLNLYQWHLLSLRAKTIDAVKTGRKAATEAQIKVNQVPAIKSQAIAEKSDVDAKDYYAEGRRAGLAYANANRVRGTASCPQRATDLPRTDRSPEVNDGPGAAPGMVAVSAEDFAILTDNSTRLTKVHQDAEELIAQGVAEKLERN